jgi:sRNA-binding carbon storage regulator CsrA
MLVLALQASERILIAKDTVIAIREIRCNQVKIGI